MSPKVQADIATRLYATLVDELKVAGGDTEDILITTCALVMGVSAGVSKGKHTLMVLGEIMDHLRKNALDGMAVVSEGPERMQ